MTSPNEPTCPHCNQSLKRLALPDNTGWEHPFDYVCFNDDCAYYQEGWEWMMEQYEVKASYRYRLNPSNNRSSPLAVWSAGALRDRIIED